MVDTDEKEFDISPLFASNKTQDINAVRNFCLKNYISPKVFIDTQIYEEQAGSYTAVPFSIDYDTMKVTLGRPYKDNTNLYIAIYIDKNYMNDTLISINDFEKSRISDTKSDRKSYK